jgi:two-component system cell cycle response regulator DivK
MPPRVLVVEDNPVNLELVAALIEREGYVALLADTADLGLRLAATERPDLIVMDIQLPGMSGYDATRRLKADPATTRIPVMALTAHAMRGDEAQARAAGFDAFLSKPIDTRIFLETVRRFLGHRSEV